MFYYCSKYSDLTQEVTKENIINITINAAQNCIVTFSNKFTEEQCNEYIQCAITYILDNYDRFLKYYYAYGKLSIITYITRIIKYHKYVFYYQTIYNYSYKEAYNYQHRYFNDRKSHKKLDLVSLEDCYNVVSDNSDISSDIIGTETYNNIMNDIDKLPYGEKAKNIIKDWINNDFNGAGLPEKYGVTRQRVNQLVKKFREFVTKKYLID